MKRGHILIAACLFIVVAIGFTTWIVKRGNKIASVATKTKPAKVNVLLLKEEPVAATLKATGTLLPIQDTTLTAKSNGTINDIHFKEGDTVVPNQLLIELNNKQQRAEYIRDKANLAMASSNVKRNQLLNKQHIVSNEDLNTIKTQFEQDKAAVIASHSALADTELRAPFNGVAGTFIRQIGDYVTQGTALVRITNTQQLIVEYKLPQSAINQVRTGQSINLRLLNTNGSNKMQAAQISFIDDNIDPDSQTFLVHATMDNRNNAFHPGNFVTVKQTLGTKEPQILVPIHSIQNNFNGSSIYVIKNDKASLQPVKLGAIHRDKVVIVHGLSVGQKIIIKSHQNLYDGMPVAVSPS